MSPNRHRRTPRLLSWSWVSFLLVLWLSPLLANAANLTGLTITPSNPTIQVGKNVQLTATGIYDDGTQQAMAQAKQVSAGGEHACALGADGTIKCWGRNTSGQLGNGTTTDSLIPVNVSGISTALAVSAGLFHTCAVLADGTLQCWGSNSFGRLGNGTTIDSSTPVTVSGISTAVAVSAGSNGHTCAVLADGTLRCWGFNNYGQLGNSSTSGYNPNSTPVAVSGISTAVAVSAGYEHSCALLADGTARCWGYNYFGQLGDGTTASSSTPVTVGGIGAAVAVSAGSDGHTCAVLVDGTLRCWGANYGGQLGNGAYFINSSTPVTVNGISTAVAVSAGDALTCAVLVDGTLRCWGRNDYGVLGSGTFTSSSIPVTVSGINNAVAVNAGGTHACALLADGTLRCWGLNNHGQLGNETITSSPIPVTVSGISTAVAVSAGGDYTCALSANGTIKCWGNNGFGQLGGTNFTVSATVSGISTALAVSAGLFHACAVLVDGTVLCWGRNTYGQLGNGAAFSSPTPIIVSGISTAVAVSAGQSHTCAVLADGTVRCWGLNNYGQLGNGTTTDSSLPVAVSGISTAMTVSVGYQSTCVLLAGGTLRCWGLNNYGQLGNGTTTDSLLPVAVSGISTAMTVSVGYQSTCAALADSTLRCWGLNNYGQLGNGTTTNSLIPATVSGISTAVAVSADYLHTCAALADGTLRCWGSNSSGQLGNGATTSSSTPVTVSGLNTAVAVSSGFNHACALLADGTARCWGNNYSGQLGNGWYFDTYYGYYSVIPTQTLDYFPLIWTSSDPTVASVDATGKVKTLNPGMALVTASVNGDSTSTLITVSPALKLDGFWSGTAVPGQFVFIFGQGFVPQQTKVQINGIPVSFVQVADPTLLFLMLPSGDTRGPITITTPNGSVTSTLSFNAPLTGVNITGIWPSVVTPGQLVFVFGAGFETNATTATVNSIKAPVLQVLEPTLLFFMAPSTPTTGFVSVTTSAGSATSASPLTIK